ncbi:MAG: AbrB/MazE/SpoVT family DNA-binding domain-containing protein [Armatimonadetes bacterium]|nr:AbrB/MazE/SpoVT family DNA-binding domain-containing protein [Armatimonadota bacterium]
MAVNLATTKMSSKGQVVIPEKVRTELGLSAGVQFLVLGHGDTVMLKVISPPSRQQFEASLDRLRRAAKAAGRTRKDVARVIAEVRGRR